tara:strand:+ start:1070 stop:1318 length:249 start_codon:yes stop_codon:yes gene_type:complete
MNYYYDYTDITSIEQSIKLQQAKLKLAQLEGTEYRIEDCKKAIKTKRKQLLVAKAKMEINKQLLVQDLMNNKKISAEPKKTV